MMKIVFDDFFLLQKHSSCIVKCGILKAKSIPFAS